MIKLFASFVIGALAILFHEPVIKSLREQVSSVIVGVDLDISTTSKPLEKQLAVFDISTQEKQPEEVQEVWTKINERGESSLHMQLKKDATSSEQSAEDGDVGHMASAVAQLSGQGASQREEDETDQGTEDPPFCDAIRAYFKDLQPALEIFHYEETQITGRKMEYEAKQPMGPVTPTPGTFSFSLQSCEQCDADSMKQRTLDVTRGLTCHKLNMIGIASESGSMSFEEIFVGIYDHPGQQMSVDSLTPTSGSEIPEPWTAEDAAFRVPFPAPSGEFSFSNRFVSVLVVTKDQSNNRQVSHFGIFRQYAQVIEGTVFDGRLKVHWDSLAPVGGSLRQLVAWSHESVRCLYESPDGTSKLFTADPCKSPEPSADSKSGAHLDVEELQAQNEALQRQVQDLRLQLHELEVARIRGA